MDKIKEKLIFYRTIFTLLFTSTFILGGGLCGVYFLHRDILNLLDNVIMFDLGIIFELSLIIAGLYTFLRIKKLIKEL